MWELLVAGIAAKWVNDFLDNDAFEKKKRDLEIRAIEAQLPPIPEPQETGWFRRRRKPPKLKSRKQLVEEAEKLLFEELEFAKKIRDPIARQAAEIAAHARFHQRVTQISGENP